MTFAKLAADRDRDSRVGAGRRLARAPRGRYDQVAVPTSATARNRLPALVGAAAFSLALSGLAEARPTLLVTGGGALDKARAAWAQADFEVAEAAYAEAVERGALGRSDLVECYAHLGASRFIVGNKDGALSAFRLAAAVDPQFEVPPESGKKAAQLADSARKQATPIKLDAGAPSHVASGAPFAVNVLIDPAQVASMSRVGLLVRDRSGGVIYRFEQPPHALVNFRVPGPMVKPGVDLAVRVDALDVHDNQLAVAEVQVEVSGSPMTGGVSERQSAAASASGSFWTTPWPYVIGGALLAAGGVGAYFVLRSPSDVSLGAARVQPN